MYDTLLGIGLVVGILAAGAFLTDLFARAMYIVCPRCHTLNARRRFQCRKCGADLTGKSGEAGTVG